jgi:hypothetical protein
MLAAQVLAGGAGAWLAFLGAGMRSTLIEAVGQLLALTGGILFMVNIVSLFRQQPGGAASPPHRHASQAEVDRIATKFMRLSGMYLVIGLGVGVALVWWRPDRGRWDLVWAHALLIGFFLSMASGVSYHVLSRWSGRPWRSVGAIRWHYRLVAVGLPFMIVALAADLEGLFLLAGPVQAAAITLVLANTAPHAWRLGEPVRAAIFAAAACLVIGVTLGVVFAADPAIGARLRQTHAIANLFGWAGLLISGFGYALAPAFAGRPLPWPWLARGQVAVLAAGVAGGIVATAWRMYGNGPDAAVVLSQAVVAVGLLLFTLQMGAIAAGERRGTAPLDLASLPWA